MAATAARVKRRLAAEARRRPALVAAVVRPLRRLGASRLGARLEAAADLVFVPTGHAGAAVHLLSCGGRDQVARDAGRDGWDAFERPLPAVLDGLVRRFCAGGRFADIGANTGYYALLASAVEPSVVVDAFEPYPPVLQTLCDNVALNRGARVEVHGVAIGASEGSAPLFVPTDEHGLIETSSSLNPQFDDTRIGSRIDVEVTTLDRLYADPTTAPRLLKIDVESLEPDVLEGGARLLEATQPLVVLELLPHEDPARLEALRQRHDYVDIRLRPTVAVIGGPVVPDPEAWNHLWCPPAQLRAVRDVLTAVGLELVKA